jgi:flagellar basal-body rod modification protein FlgD
MSSVGYLGAGQAANLSGTTGTQVKKQDNVGRDEFLQLLVTQLKYQDPEAPMDSKEFAVQLAQFTQVEKLVSIDQQLSKQSQNMSSMTGYLGNKVVLSSSDVLVKARSGGQLQLDLSQDAQNVRIQLLDRNGAVVGESVVDQLAKGKQLVSLDGVAVPDGAYSVKVTAASKYGAGDFTVPAAVSGIVSGFIPGPDPRLIVNGREISVGEIKEVSIPSA